MAHSPPIIIDRAEVESTTEGDTDPYALGPAIDGNQDFSAIPNGRLTFYAAVEAPDFEIGIAAVSDSGDTLTPVEVLDSSNGGDRVDWGPGTRTIFCTMPAAALLDYADDDPPAVAWDGRKWFDTDTLSSMVHYDGEWVEVGTAVAP